MAKPDSLIESILGKLFNRRRNFRTGSGQRKDPAYSLGNNKENWKQTQKKKKKTSYMDVDCCSYRSDIKLFYFLAEVLLVERNK